MVVNLLSHTHTHTRIHMYVPNTATLCIFKCSPPHQPCWKLGNSALREFHNKTQPFSTLVLQKRPTQGSESALELDAQVDARLRLLVDNRCHFTDCGCGDGALGVATSPSESLSAAVVMPRLPDGLRTFWTWTTGRRDGAGAFGTTEAVPVASHRSTKHTPKAMGYAPDACNSALRPVTAPAARSTRLSCFSLQLHFRTMSTTNGAVDANMYGFRKLNSSPVTPHVKPQRYVVTVVRPAIPRSTGSTSLHFQKKLAGGFSTMVHRLRDFPRRMKNIAMHACKLPLCTLS